MHAVCLISGVVFLNFTVIKLFFVFIPVKRKPNIFSQSIPTMNASLRNSLPSMSIPCNELAASLEVRPENSNTPHVTELGIEASRMLQPEAVNFQFRKPLYE